MTTIQNPTLRITAAAFRIAGVTVVTITAAALFIVAVGSTSGAMHPTHVLSVLPTWTLSGYFAVLGSYLTFVAVTRGRANADKAEAHQFDIR